MKEYYHYYGASLSVKVCRDYSINQLEVLNFAVKDLGIKHFRLMSYWDEIEPNIGQYNFADLDEQFRLLEKLGAKISLSIGIKQPRWPECHAPKWTNKITQPQKEEALLSFIELVIKRYKNSPALLNYQLENEALLKNFGDCPNHIYSRSLLKKELSLVKQIDPKRNIIMSVSNNWGLPILGPLPDIFGFSLYRIMHRNGKYHRSIFPVWWYKLRAKVITFYTKKPVLIHELQLEPWGPNANHEMNANEQAHSMSLSQLQSNLIFARKTKLYPIYFWGLEWWYVKSKQDNSFKKNLIEVIKINEL